MLGREKGFDLGAIRARFHFENGCTQQANLLGQGVQNLISAGVPRRIDF